MCKVRLLLANLAEKLANWLLSNNPKKVEMRKRIGLWFCRVIGWHSYPHFDSFDGCSATATCKKCGYKGLVDSQGNLF